MLSDAKPVEATEEVKPEEKPVDPAANAAHHMPAMLAYFKNMIEDSRFGGVHAKAVLLALAEAPFNENPPEFTTPQQYELYNLGINIFNGKFLILMASLRDQKNQTKTEETKEEKANDQEV